MSEFIVNSNFAPNAEYCIRYPPQRVCLFFHPLFQFIQHLIRALRGRTQARDSGDVGIRLPLPDVEDHTKGILDVAVLSLSTPA
jgi:hypothetical protein